MEPQKGRTMAKTQQVSVDLPEIGILEVTIENSPGRGLIVHRFGQKAKNEMLAKQVKGTRKKKELRDPDQEYRDSLYYLNGSARYESEGGPKKLTGKEKFGFPANAVKNAMVSACRTVDGLPMTMARTVFFVMGTHGDLIQVHGKPQKREDIVRLSGPSRDPMVRFRAEFPEWEMTFRVEYEKSLIEKRDILNLLQKAGFHVGLGDWRPEKSGNTFGRFVVKDAKDIKTDG